MINQDSSKTKVMPSPLIKAN